MTATVLAGDIGGTHARFARVHSGPGRVVLGEAQTYDVAGSPSLEALVVAVKNVSIRTTVGSIVPPADSSRRSSS